MIETVWAGSQCPTLRDAVTAWASERIRSGGGHQFGECVCLGAFHDGKIIGCVVFNNYNPESETIEFSMASSSRRWLTARVMEEMRRYCIDQLNCQLVMAKTSAKNKHIRKMLKAYGFQEHIIPRLFGREEDGVIFTITDEEVKKSDIGRRGENGST